MIRYLLWHAIAADDHHAEHLYLSKPDSILTLFSFCYIHLLFVNLTPSVVDKRGTGFPGYTLSSSSTSSSGSTATPRGASTGSTTSGGSAPVLSKEAKARQEEMREVRLQQQEIANERHIEAEKERKQKKDEERARKNEVAQAARSKNTAGDNRLGGSEARSGFNPMMPSTGMTGGYR
jgi:hypothetical protein